MPRTVIPVSTALRSGGVVVPIVSDETNGMSVLIRGNEVLRITNNGASPRTVSFNSIQLSNFGTDENASCVVGVGLTVTVGPFTTQRWANASGVLEVDFSAGTSTDLSIEALRGLFGQPDNQSN